MKKLHFLVITTLLLIADAEPPSNYRFRKNSRRLQFQRQQLAPTPQPTTDSSTDLTTNQPEVAPYPAAGSKPGGLPASTTAAPSGGPYPPSGWKPQGRKLELPTEAETQPPPTTAAPSGGPYPPSGWKPQGRQLELPTEAETQPSPTYGPPSQEYGPPSQEYGPPQEGTESPNELDDGVVEIDGGDIDGTAPSKSQEGFYFITLPDGTIQKVSYSTFPGNRIVLQTETVGQAPQQSAPVAENGSKPKVVSFVQQYQAW